jgi:hypothetical protein
MDQGACDAVALAARLTLLLPRLGAATLRASYRQFGEVTGLDYSLIDYKGVFAAAAQFALAWWREPLHALKSQADLAARSLSLFQQSNEGDTKPPDSSLRVDKRFGDGAWSRDPTLSLARDLYLLFAEWLLAQIDDYPALCDHDQQKLAFYTRQVLCACAPQQCSIHQPERAHAGSGNARPKPGRQVGEPAP